MARHIHIHVSTKDAGNWEENKHPRADNGQFGKGSGGGAKPAAKTAPAAKKAADPAKMQSTLATINKRLAAGNLTSASKEELTAKRNRIKIEMEKGRLSKSEPKEGDVGHEELTKYGKYLTKGEKVKDPYGKQVEVIRHTGPEVLTTGGSYHPTKLSRVETPSGRSMTPKEAVAQTNANAGKLNPPSMFGPATGGGKMKVDPISHRTSMENPPPSRSAGTKTEQKSAGNAAHFAQLEKMALERAADFRKRAEGSPNKEAMLLRAEQFEAGVAEYRRLAAEHKADAERLASKPTDVPLDTKRTDWKQR